MSEFILAGSEKRVVSLFRVKPAINFKNIYTSSDGEVFYRRKNRFFKAKQHYKKTTKGSYLNCNVFSIPKNKRVSVGVHRLVCEGWHKLPSNHKDLVYVPDHIDSDKHNNKSENLRWVTQSQNVQNAFNDGICTGGLRVVVTDITTDEIFYYNSLSKLARDFGIKRWSMRQIIANHRETPYMDQWLFDLNKESDEKLARYQRCSVAIKDYENNTITIVNDATTAFEKTGIGLGTVFSQLRKEIPKLCYKYVFRKLSENMFFPNFTKEEIAVSIKNHHSRKNKSNTT